jgi:hypothetical protein
MGSGTVFRGVIGGIAKVFDVAWDCVRRADGTAKSESASVTDVARPAR